MKNTMNWLSGILFVVAFIPYIIATIRNGRKIARGEDASQPPKKASWLIWGTLDWIELLAMTKKDSPNRGQIWGACIGVVVVIIAVFIYGERGWKKKDKWYLAASALGIAFLFIEPDYALLTACVTAFIGSFSTFENYRNEDMFSWTIFWVAAVCAVIAIPNLTLDPTSISEVRFQDAAQPLTFFTVESTMMCLLLYRSWR